MLQKPWFNMRKYKMWRVAFFVGIAASAAMPFAHMAFLFGRKETFAFLCELLRSSSLPCLTDQSDQSPYYRRSERTS